jgi:hypothetical protein
VKPSIPKTQSKLEIPQIRGGRGGLKISNSRYVTGESIYPDFEVSRF